MTRHLASRGVAVLVGVMACSSARASMKSAADARCAAPLPPAVAGDSIENIYPVWSPDGRWIAFTSRRVGNFDIYLIRPDGSELTRLTSHPGIDAHPAWSPSGNHIAFDTDRDGNRQSYIMRADGCDQQNVSRSGASCGATGRT